MPSIADRVKETTTTTGTGTISLGGAATGFQSFASAFATGTDVYYCITDGAHWEVGHGVFTASGNTLARTVVIASSNGGALVNFTAGSKDAFCTAPAKTVANLREVLTADRTYYVRPDGSDSNNGLANTAGGAFLTVQYAANTIGRLIDGAGYIVTIQLADGTYNEDISLVPVPNALYVVIQGNAGTPTNVVVNSATTACFYATYDMSTVFWIKDMKLTAGGSSNGLLANTCSFAYSGIDFGTIGGNQMYAAYGGKIMAVGNYTISGGALRHLYAHGGGLIYIPYRTITISNTPAFSQAFVDAQSCAVVPLGGCTWTGSATGKRYNVISSATVNVLGAGATALPGNVSGTTATGGIYA